MTGLGNLAFSASMTALGILSRSATSFLSWPVAIKTNPSTAHTPMSFRMSRLRMWALPASVANARARLVEHDLQRLLLHLDLKLVRRLLVLPFDHDHFLGLDDLGPGVLPLQPVLHGLGHLVLGHPLLDVQQR